MTKNFILFDFDGVIADSFRAAYGVANMMCPHLTEDEHRRRFEGNIHDWEEPVDRHTKDCRQDIDFFEEYVPRLKKSEIFSGMKEIIAGLAQGYTLVIVSSTVTSPIQDYLNTRDLATYFSWVMGADVHTSKVEKIKMVFEKYEIGPESCVFITDTLGDILEAEKTGIGAIGVTWGFHKPETLKRGNPFRLVDSPDVLPVAISDYFSQ
ncbi:MAG: HAD hydrolase-like protein [Candidatus Pacebacteria bacterium]|nr:HAD hydrolase-like protein [Candidatus Paceibacterota bacterium]